MAISKQFEGAGRKARPLLLYLGIHRALSKKKKMNKMKINGCKKLESIA